MEHGIILADVDGDSNRKREANAHSLSPGPTLFVVLGCSLNTVIE